MKHTAPLTSVLLAQLFVAAARRFQVMKITGTVPLLLVLLLCRRRRRRRRRPVVSTPTWTWTGTTWTTAIPVSCSIRVEDI